MSDGSVLIDTTMQMIKYHEEKVGSRAPHPYCHPTWIYTSFDLAQQEYKKIFMRRPQVVCLSSDLPGAGSFYTFDDLDVPVLLVRNDDLMVSAFLNICPHRSARLKDGCGNATSITCPYHAWNFGLNGSLNKVYKEDYFGAIEQNLYSLIKLPVIEKFGLIFLGLNSNTQLLIDEYMAEMAPHLNALQLQDMEFLVGDHVTVKANWKLALESNFEIYHFPILHNMHGAKDVLLYQSFGKDIKHHLTAISNESILELKGASNRELEVGILKNGYLEYFIYPNIILNVQMDSVILTQIYPGKSPNENITHMRLYRRKGGSEAFFNPNITYDDVRRIVFEEDYSMCEKIQKNLDAGLKPYSTFGQNELALINMHQAFLRDVGVDPDKSPFYDPKDFQASRV